MNRYALAADAVLVLHLLFIVLVAGGGLLVLRRLRWAWLHLPALAWGLWISVSHGLCPLTPLENALRRRAGEAGYDGGFVDHYVAALVYPEGLTAAHQLGIAAFLAVLNAVLYGWALLRARRRQRGGGP